jgi:hypothetical protein
MQILLPTDGKSYFFNITSGFFANLFRDKEQLAKSLLAWNSAD